MGIPKLNRTRGINVAKTIADVLGCSFVMLGHGKFALVDSDDFQRIKDKLWVRSPDGYAVSRVSFGEKQKTIIMHRILLELPNGFNVDHKNRVAWDNRRLNIRIATKHQNRGNTPATKFKKSSRFKGVFPCKKRWKVVVGEKDKVRHIGCFSTETEAAIAYNRWARQHFGEFAYLNPV